MIQDEVDAVRFAIQLDTLREHFSVLPLNEAIDRLRAGTLPTRAAAITFDDGYANNAEVALPILVKKSMHATFFIATGSLGDGYMWNDAIIQALRSAPGPTLDLSAISFHTYSLRTIADRRAALDDILPRLKARDPASRHNLVAKILQAAESKPPSGIMMTHEQVRSLDSAGMDIGGHTVNHPILTTLTADEAKREIVEGKKNLERIIGRPVQLFAYPNGKPGQDFDGAHVAMVKAAGFSAAVSTAPGAARADSDPYQLPRFTPWDRSPARFTLRLFKNAMLKHIHTA